MEQVVLYTEHKEVSRYEGQMILVVVGTDLGDGARVQVRAIGEGAQELLRTMVKVLLEQTAKVLQNDTTDPFTGEELQ